MLHGLQRRAAEARVFITSAAMSRAGVTLGDRRPFYLYVDEFGSVATRFFISLLSEGRKFGISLVLANQFCDQIDVTILKAILGNVGTQIAFRLGQTDAEKMAPQLRPSVRRSDLVNLPNWKAYTRALVEGQPVAPFSLQTLPPDSPRGASGT